MEDIRIEPPVLRAAGEARSDAQRRLIVDAGIAIQGSSNTMCAVEYLRMHGVRGQVIERVLMDSRRRRATG